MFTRASEPKTGRAWVCSTLLLALLFDDLGRDLSITANQSGAATKATSSGAPAARVGIRPCRRGDRRRPSSITTRTAAASRATTTAIVAGAELERTRAAAPVPLVDQVGVALP